MSRPTTKREREELVEVGRDRLTRGFQRIDPEYAEVPAVPDGTTYRCTKCGSNRVAYPTRTIDERWAFGRCQVCHHDRIFDVIFPGGLST